MPKNYIPSPDCLTSIYNNPCFCGRWVVVEKAPISQIKIDKALFSFQNEVNLNDVDRICKEFLIGAWYPIMFNPEYFLLDEQHRLAAAKRMELKYIDVVDCGDEAQDVKPTKKIKASQIVREYLLWNEKKH